MARTDGPSTTDAMSRSDRTSRPARRRGIGLLLVSGLMLQTTGLQAAPPTVAFVESKTCFQTNTARDPRLALAVDGVILHLHGADDRTLQQAMHSWAEAGHAVGRMFFSDSDATNAYWQGRWDGTPRPDEVERDREGNVVMCAGIRPYMLPTPGWSRHLQEMVGQSLAAGAQAILPEEPLAHTFSGYEPAFKPVWEQRYQRPFEPPHTSSVSHYLSARLKGELYARLMSDLQQALRRPDGTALAGPPSAYIYPVHSLYSNVASQLVAPIGTSLSQPGIDGYIGQVWTGPINWSLANYDSPDKSFIAAACILYDSFAELTRGTAREPWLLTDPVEDDPNHTWPEFEAWYRLSTAAALLQTTTDRYEVMPWPDRIFLPGYTTGGSTPAPERFRVLTLSAVQIQQEVPLGGTWTPARPADGRDRIGVLVADSLMWHPSDFPRLQAPFGMLMPLLVEGIPVSSCLMERLAEPGYLDAFAVLVLSYEHQSPPDADVHRHLADWVRAGGQLIVLGEPVAWNDPLLWWTAAGEPDPLRHLLKLLSIPSDPDGSVAVGQGRLYRRTISPGKLGDPQTARSAYLPLLEEAYRARTGRPLDRPGYLCVRRGPFVIAAGLREPVHLTGPLIDLFEPDFPLLAEATVAPGDARIYRQVADLPAPGEQTSPRLLHCTHRLMTARQDPRRTEIVLRGPAETPAVARLWTAGRQLTEARAIDAAGQIVPVTSVPGPDTLLVRFPNHPAGVTLTLSWAP